MSFKLSFSLIVAQSSTTHHLSTRSWTNFSFLFPDFFPNVLVLITFVFSAFFLVLGIFYIYHQPITSSSHSIQWKNRHRKTETKFAAFFGSHQPHLDSVLLCFCYLCFCFSLFCKTNHRTRTHVVHSWNVLGALRTGRFWGAWSQRLSRTARMDLWCTVRRRCPTHPRGMFRPWHRTFSYVAALDQISRVMLVTVLGLKLDLSRSRHWNPVTLSHAAITRRPQKTKPKWLAYVVSIILIRLSMPPFLNL